MTERRGGFEINRAYQILGVSPGASQAKIKNAYRQLVKIWHPDRFTTETDKLVAEEKIKEINAAYHVLKSDEVRAEVVEEDNSVDETTNIPAPETSQNNSSETRFYVRQSVPAAEFFYQQGVEKVQEGKYESAIAFFANAIKANPYYIEAYKYRGLSCSQLGLEMRATADLTKAAELEWHFRGKKKQTPKPPHERMHRNYYKNNDTTVHNRVEFKVKTSYTQRTSRKKNIPICRMIQQRIRRLFRF